MINNIYIEINMHHNISYTIYDTASTVTYVLFMAYYSLHAIYRMLCTAYGALYTKYYTLRAVY